MRMGATLKLRNTLLFLELFLAMKSHTQHAPQVASTWSAHASMVAASGMPL
jgi:hypothetical protein